VTQKNLASYKERIEGLRAMEREEIGPLRKQRADARGLMKEMEANGRRETENFQQASGLEAEIAGMLWQHRKRLLELGAAGRLLIAGDIKEVLPLDDAELLEKANPTTGGRVKFDQAKVAARRDAIVRAATRREGVAVIILGGGHNLSDSVRRVGGGRCEYIRVTTRRFREHAR
jgi:hypothetical protein